MNRRPPADPRKCTGDGWLFTCRRTAWAWGPGIHLLLFAACLPIYLLCLFWPDDRLPGIRCAFNEFTGAPCPSCGFTRSFLWMGRGEWARACLNSPFASALFMVFIIFMGTNLVGAVCRLQIKPGRLFQWRRRGWLVFVMTTTVLLTADWLYRCYHGLL